MNTTRPSFPRRPLTRKEAWSCCLLNQLATPGMGSLLARRWFAGAGQLALCITGFSLFLVWILRLLRFYYGQMSGTAGIPEVHFSPHGKWGMILFAASWFWALFTGVQIVRDSEKPPPPPPCLPPRINS